MKFKVGDKVKRLYGGSERLPVGTIAKIIEMRSNGDIKVEGFPTDWWDEQYFELVEEQTIKYGFNLSIDGITIRILPKQVFFNEKKKTTVLKWEDNSITKVKCHDEEFDERTGFLIAYFQKTCGLTKNKANKYLDSLLPKEEVIIEEKDTPIEILDTEEEEVFSVYKWLKEMKLKKPCKWCKECDGKTIIECETLGFGIVSNWLVPRSQYKPYRED